MNRLLSFVVFTAFVVTGVCAVMVWTLLSFHHFDHIENAFGGICEPVTGISGPEDLQIDRQRHIAYISSNDRRAPKTLARGAIYAFELDDPLSTDAWRDRTETSPAEFEPIGLSYYEDETFRRLFVVNAATQSVELFDVTENGDLDHIESFKERRMTSPNDLVAVGPRAFYVTNDVESGRGGLLATLQFLARIGSGQILYFDGVAWKVSAEGLRFANGINVSLDGRRLYAAETSGGALQIYDRDLEKGLLTLSTTVPMEAALDNIDIDETGALWIAAHPKPLMLPQLMLQPEARAPSLVLRYEDKQAQQTGPETVYVNDGHELSAATVAARAGNMLLIGALTEDKFLICQLSD